MQLPGDALVHAHGRIHSGAHLLPAAVQDPFRQLLQVTGQRGKKSGLQLGDLRQQRPSQQTAENDDLRLAVPGQAAQVMQQ